MKTTPQTQTSERIPFEAVDEKFFDDGFLVDLDHAFDALQVTPSGKKKTKTSKKDRKRDRAIVEMQTTYLAIAQEHLRPTLRYLKAIKQGLASRDLCDIVHYVVGSLIGKTRKVGLADETKTLIVFQRELKKVLAVRSYRITIEQRQALADSFVPVSRAFELEFRGHSTAVFNLLGYYKAIKRNPDVTEQDMKKLFSIGIPSLTMIRKSSIADLSSLAGLSTTKATSVRNAARNFSILSLI